MTPKAWALLGILLTGVALAGCSQPGETVNPHLLSPKLIVSETEDGGSLEVYVHSAVGERQYDSLVLSVDNVTRISRNVTFGIIERIPSNQSFISVVARLGDNVFTLEAAIQHDPDSGKVEIATFSDGKEIERREVDLPWNKLIEKEEKK